MYTRQTIRSRNSWAFGCGLACAARWCAGCAAYSLGLTAHARLGVLDTQNPACSCRCHRASVLSRVSLSRLGLAACQSHSATSRVPVASATCHAQASRSEKGGGGGFRGGHRTKGARANGQQRFGCAGVGRAGRGVHACALGGLSSFAREARKCANGVPFGGCSGSGGLAGLFMALRSAAADARDAGLRRAEASVARALRMIYLSHGSRDILCTCGPANILASSARGAQRHGAGNMVATRDTRPTPEQLHASI
eukprot:7279593-Prymnesium_polylepis.1